MTGLNIHGPDSSPEAVPEADGQTGALPDAPATLPMSSSAVGEATTAPHVETSSEAAVVTTNAAGLASSTLRQDKVSSDPHPSDHTDVSVSSKKDLSHIPSAFQGIYHKIISGEQLSGEDRTLLEAHKITVFQRKSSKGKTKIELVAENRIINLGAFAQVVHSMGEKKSGAVKLPFIKDLFDDVKVMAMIRQKAANVGVPKSSLAENFIMGKEVVAPNGSVGLLMPVASGKLKTEDTLPLIQAHYARGLVESVALLHRLGLVHRDIKLDNVLIHENRAKLADFGCCVAKEHAVDGPAGTKGFQAFEVAFDPNVPHTQSSDSFAVGLLLAQLLRKNDFRFYGPPKGLEKRYADIEDFRTKLELANVQEINPNKFYKVVTGLLNPDPASRLTMDDAVSLFNQIEDKDIAAAFEQYHDSYSLRSKSFTINLGSPPSEQIR